MNVLVIWDGRCSAQKSEGVDLKLYVSKSQNAKLPGADLPGRQLGATFCSEASGFAGLAWFPLERAQFSWKVLEGRLGKGCRILNFSWTIIRRKSSQKEGLVYLVSQLWPQHLHAFTFLFITFWQSWAWERQLALPHFRHHAHGCVHFFSYLDDHSTCFCFKYPQDHQAVAAVTRFFLSLGWYQEWENVVIH